MPDDCHILPPNARPHLTKYGRAELLAQAEAEFDGVIGELQTQRRQLVDAGDYESLSRLAANLLGET